jgi:predicted chitinase
MLTLDQFKSIMPHCPDAKAQLCLPHLNAAMQEAQINTKLRAAAFIAQLAHESGEMRYMEELASGKAYEGRVDLGNTQPGDGPRYKGRGPIQVTGRTNYEKAGAALGLDLVGHPEQVATYDVGFRTACWFWTSHHLNDLADKGDIVTISKRINGGTNGLEQRKAYYAKALSVLT